MKDFGKQVKTLRQAKKMTKEEFCEDEIELSVRQLTRIESGVSIPTLAKVEFIAKRLGVSIGELTDKKKFILPKRYKEIKFLLLRTQTYLEQDRIAKREAYLEEIFDNYYDDLPEEEQLIVEILQSILDIVKQFNDFSAKKILKDYLEQIKHKSTYGINDLILVDLYAMYVSYKGYQPSIYDEKTHQHIIEVLLQADQNLQVEEFFILCKSIGSTASNCAVLKDKDNLDRLIFKMEDLMQQTQDFQRTHVLNILKWKSYLLEDNLESAEICYRDACVFSNATNPSLTAKLTQEWKKDIKNLPLRT